MCKRVLQSLVQMFFWQPLRDIFVEDLFRDFTETLMTNWSKTRSTLRRRLCGRLDRWLDDISTTTLCKIWSVTDRQLIDYFVRDLWKTHLTKIFERHQRIKKFTRCVDEKISTRCVKFLRTQISNCSRRTQVSIRNRSPIGACDLKYDIANSFSRFFWRNCLD